MPSKLQKKKSDPSKSLLLERERQDLLLPHYYRILERNISLSQIQKAVFIKEEPILIHTNSLEH